MERVDHVEQFATFLDKALEKAKDLDNLVMTFGIVIHTYDRQERCWRRIVFGSDTTFIKPLNITHQLWMFLRYLPTHIRWSIKVWINRKINKFKNAWRRTNV